VFAAEQILMVKTTTATTRRTNHTMALSQGTTLCCTGETKLFVDALSAAQQHMRTALGAASSSSAMTAMCQLLT
jgi:hypothetical protein